MNRLLISWTGLLVATLTLSACSKPGPKFDKDNPPTGGTRAELAYQMATRLAAQGYCATAMPVFVCLAGQGAGWEVAAQGAGECAPTAAKLWKASGLTADHAPQSEADRGHEATFKLQQSYAYQSSAEGILAEGLRQLRRAANANWPEAQAELAIQLHAAGGQNLAEARHWMERYDANARRKIYGGDEIPPAIRKTLKQIPRSGAGGSQWFPIAFSAEPSSNHDCDRLLGKRPNQQKPNRHESHGANNDDDGIEKIKPRHQSGIPTTSGGGHKDH